MLAGACLLTLCGCGRIVVRLAVSVVPRVAMQRRLPGRLFRRRPTCTGRSVAGANVLRKTCAGWLPHVPTGSRRYGRQGGLRHGGSCSWLHDLRSLSGLDGGNFIE